MNAINLVLSQNGVDSKFAPVLAQFFSLPVPGTGWNWGDSVEAALESGHRIDMAALPLGAFLSSAVPGVVGFTWRQAVEEALSYGQAVDLTEPLTAFLAARESAQAALSVAGLETDDFERSTGWSRGDAVMLACELNRERRIFGYRH